MNMETPNSFDIFHLKAAMEPMTAINMRKSRTMEQTKPLLSTFTGVP